MKRRTFIKGLLGALASFKLWGKIPEKQEIIITNGHENVTYWFNGPLVIQSEGTKMVFWSTRGRHEDWETHK